MADSPPSEPKPTGFSTFWQELRRRKVVRVAVVYAVVAWLLIQVSATVFPQVGLPDWTSVFVTWILIIGFPIALIIAWAFEVTPEGIITDAGVGVGEGVAPAKGQKLHYVTLGLVVLVLTFLVVDRYLFSPDLSQTAALASPASSGSVARSIIKLPEDQRQPRLMRSPLAISPDGTVIAYIARDETGAHLFLRRLGSFETKKIPGTEFGSRPFFSPDSEWVGFFAGGKLKRVSVQGGLPAVIADAPDAHGGSWGPDDRIVFVPARNSGLWRVATTGGEPERLTFPDDDGHGAHVHPQHLPGGKHVLFQQWDENWGARVIDLETGTWQPVQNILTSESCIYIRSGHLLYSDYEVEGSVLAVPFDLQNFSVTGPSVPVLEDVRIWPTYTSRLFMAISENGTVVYVPHKMDKADLMWVDRNGRTSSIRSDVVVLASIRLSPDERTFAYHDERGALLAIDANRGTTDLLLSDPNGVVTHPVWDSNGEHVLFSFNPEGSWDLYKQRVSTREKPTPVLIGDGNQANPTQSKDGRLIAYIESLSGEDWDVRLLIDGEETVAVAATDANEFSPAISPDGTLLAYISDETGKPEVYVMTYPDREVRVVSIGGGEEPVWSRDGQELFFRQGDALLSVAVTADPELEISAPEVVFQLAFDRSSGMTVWSSPYYDVSNDGERFLVVSNRPTTEFKLIQNWFQELEGLVPTDQ